MSYINSLRDLLAEQHDALQLELANDSDSSRVVILQKRIAALVVTLTRLEHEGEIEPVDGSVSSFLDWYAAQVVRTAYVLEGDTKDVWRNVALGLAGEAGEVASRVLKEVTYAPTFDAETTREKLIEELGDVLWYVAAFANAIDASIASIMQANVAKLRERHKKGFDRNHYGNASRFRAAKREAALDELVAQAQEDGDYNLPLAEQERYELRIAEREVDAEFKVVTITSNGDFDRVYAAACEKYEARVKASVKKTARTSLPSVVRNGIFELQPKYFPNAGVFAVHIATESGKPFSHDVLLKIIDIVESW